MNSQSFVQFVGLLAAVLVCFGISEIKSQQRYNALNSSTRAYELDIVDDRYILYDGPTPVAVLDSVEVGRLHYVILKDNE